MTSAANPGTITHDGLRGDPVSARRLHAVLIVLSPAIAVLVSLAMDVALLATTRQAPAEILFAAVLFNGASVLQASVGALVEVRRPGHRVGRLLMLTGPLYAVVAALWLTAEELERTIGTTWIVVLNVLGAPLSYVAVALFTAGVPLLFPTGSLPGPRWRIPVNTLAGLFAVGVLVGFLRPGPLPGTTLDNPFGVVGLPQPVRILEGLIPITLVALIALGLASQAVRYRRGNATERVQVRWLAAAVTVALAGFVGVFVEMAIQVESGPLASAWIANFGIELIPIAIGIAILRYRLYEIDRIISRTIGWAIVTAILAITFVGGIIVVQGVLTPFTASNTLGVAVSTLLAAAIFQPLRHRVQNAVDRRFDRTRYDGERTTAAFASRLRDEVDFSVVTADFVSTAAGAVRPTRASIWLSGDRGAKR